MGPAEARVARLIDLHWEAAYQAAYRILADRDEALDAVQDSLLVLHERLETVDDARAGAWLRRVASNKALDRFRRRRTRAASDHADERLVDPRPRPPAAAECEESRDRVVAALDRLSARQREVVMRRTLDGESFVAIAASLEISEGATKVHFRRGLQALQRTLPRHSVEEELR